MSNICYDSCLSFCPRVLSRKSFFYRSHYNSINKSNNSINKSNNSMNGSMNKNRWNTLFQKGCPKNYDKGSSMKSLNEMMRILKELPDLINIPNMIHNPNVSYSFFNNPIRWIVLSYKRNGPRNIHFGGFSPSTVSDFTSDPNFFPAKPLESVRIPPSYGAVYHWKDLSRTHWIPLSYIETTIHRPWDFSLLSKHPSVTLEFYRKYYNRFHSSPGYISRISENPNISLEQMIRHPEIQWNWDQAIMNPAIHWHDIVNHPEIPWKYGRFIGNPNVTIEIIRENMEVGWEWDLLAKNLFAFDHGFAHIARNTLFKKEEA